MTQAGLNQTYDDADLTRAITAYKFFYPTVSGAAIIKGLAQDILTAPQLKTNQLPPLLAVMTFPLT